MDNEKIFEKYSYIGDNSSGNFVIQGDNVSIYPPNGNMNSYQEGLKSKTPDEESTKTDDNSNPDKKYTEFSEINIEETRDNTFESTSDPMSDGEIKVKKADYESRGILHMDTLKEIITNDRKMYRIFDIIEKGAHSKCSFLILGESGTGKEQIARLIHMSSKRSDDPFIPINCATIPEGLVESELFGHKKGSFTGANSDKIGFFMTANNGTVFLDEIADLPLLIQPKLLRVLQEQIIKQVGSTEFQKVDVRIICATSKDIKEMMRNGKFREDLFYRINTIVIKLPSLRERQDDISILVDHFVEKLNNKPEGKNLKVSSSTYAEFYKQPWIGNIRELEHTVERCYLLSEKELSSEFISSEVGTCISGQENNSNKSRSSLQDDQSIYNENYEEKLDKCNPEKTSSSDLSGWNEEEEIKSLLVEVLSNGVSIQGAEQEAFNLASARKLRSGKSYKTFCKRLKEKYSDLYWQLKRGELL